MNRLLFSLRWSKFFFSKQKNKMADSKTSTFELDFKLVSNSCFGPHLRYLKTPKSQNMSSYIARDPQNCPSSHKENLFGVHKQHLQGCRFNFHCTSCTCKPSTIWKCSKVVYSIWVGQYEFFKGWNDCYWGLEVADTQIW